MRICYVTESFFPELDGGAVHSKLLAERFHQAGHDVLIYTRHAKESYLRTEMVSGCPVKRVGLDDRYGMFGRYLGMLTILPPLFRKRNQYDVVLIAAPRILGAPVLLLMKLINKRCVIKPDSCGEMDGSYALSQVSSKSPIYLMAKLYFWFRNIILKRADAYVAISADLVDEMRRMGIDSRAISQIPNGVDVHKFSPIKASEKSARRLSFGLPEDEIIISYCGRLTHEKGLKSLVRVWKEIKKFHEKVHLLLIGSGEGMSLDCEDELKKFVDVNGLSDSVTFTGAVDDVPGYLGCADVFVLPSITEALPLALIEAQLSGIPAIASDVGGVPEVVTNDVNGLLVPHSNDDELFVAINELIQNSKKRLTMGKAARESAVERFSISAVTNSYLSLLESVIQSAGINQKGLG